MAVQFGANINEVNINLQGAKEFAGQAKNVTIGDFVNVGQVVKEAAGLAVQVNEQQKRQDSAKKAVDGDRAKQDYLNKVTSEEYLSLPVSQRADSLENDYKNLGEFSEAYQSVYKSLSANEYTKNFEGRAKSIRTAYYNKADASYKVWQEEASSVIVGEEGPSVEAATRTNRDAGTNPAEFINEYVKQYPGLETSVIRNALVGSMYQDASVQISTAADAEELSIVLGNVEELKAPFKNPMFLNTKQKEGAAVVSEYERQLGMSIKGKQAEFKNQAYGRLSQATQGGYRTLPMLVSKDIDMTAANPLAATKQKMEYQKKWEERTIADEYTSNNPIGSRTQSLPKDNKIVMKERQEAVTQNLVQAISTEDYENFARIAYNEKDFGKNTGEYLLNNINQATDPAEIKALTGFLSNVNSTNQGPTALRQMFTDTQYTRLSAMNSISLSHPEMNMVDIRNAIDKAKSSTTIIKLDRGTEQDIQEIAVKLGKQGFQYLEAVNQLRSIDPQLAKDEYKKIGEYFASTIDSDSDLGGVKVDTSMGQKPEAMNIETFNATITKELIKDADSITWMSNSKGDPLIAVHDKLGATKIFNAQPYLDENKEEEEFKALHGLNKSSGAALFAKSAIRSAVDNTFDFVIGTGEVLETLGTNISESDTGSRLYNTMSTRFINHFIDSMTSGQAEFFGLKQGQTGIELQEFKDKRESNRVRRDLEIKMLEENEDFQAFMYEGLTRVEQENSNLEAGEGINTQGDFTQMSMREYLRTADTKKTMATETKKEMINKDIPSEVVASYDNFSKAETGGVKNPWIRTLVRTAKGGSTAFGPVQMTGGLLKGVRKNISKYKLTKIEKETLDILIDQSTLFNKHGNNKGKMKGFNSSFDYGGEGMLSGMSSTEKELFKKNYESLAKKMMKEMHTRLKGDTDKIISEWRFGPKYTVEKAKEEDQEYYNRYYK